jgi:hypothetical protein
LRRKFQVCNGYLLEFDQLARVLNYLAGDHTAKKVSRAALADGTGLSDRQLESLVSVGCAMGLIRRGVQILSEPGKLVAQYDVFLEARGSLEWCHYKGAGSYRNLIWYEIFNAILPREQSMAPEGWMANLREALAGQYTDRTIGKHLHEEVRFVADAYLERHFSRLQLLYESSDGSIGRRRYSSPDLRVFAAILHDYGGENGTNLLQVRDLSERPGAPGYLFSLDEGTLRMILEGLHEKGWVRYEGTHNLDQIRLKSEFSYLSFLSAYYEDREPTANTGSN